MMHHALVNPSIGRLIKISVENPKLHCLLIDRGNFNRRGEVNDIEDRGEEMGEMFISFKSQSKWFNYWSLFKSTLPFPSSYTEGQDSNSKELTHQSYSNFIWMELNRKYKEEKKL